MYYEAQHQRELLARNYLKILSVLIMNPSYESLAAEIENVLKEVKATFQCTTVYNQEGMPPEELVNVCNEAMKQVKVGIRVIKLERNIFPG